jgi:hypothetical protein
MAPWRYKVATLMCVGSGLMQQTGDMRVERKQYQ